MEPTHIVVDTRDGYLFRAAGDGMLFTAATARAFAAHRNEDFPAAEHGRDKHHADRDKRHGREPAGVTAPYVVRRLVPDETPREQFARAYAERRREVLTREAS